MRLRRAIVSISMGLMLASATVTKWVCASRRPGAASPRSSR
jgi:hypothetical protein